MFRQDEVLIGGWREMTVASMEKRRFTQSVSQLSALGSGRLEQLNTSTLMRRVAASWQDVPCRPLRSQMIDTVWGYMKETIAQQADCLSKNEHELIEDALILGQSVPIRDVWELEAAKALSMRLWGHVGVVDGKPYFEIERELIRPIAGAMTGAAHERIRARLAQAHAAVRRTLYREGAVDDRQPQELILRGVFERAAGDELLSQLARRNLWATYDCVDYRGGVMLLHPAVAEPHRLIAGKRKRQSLLLPMQATEQEEDDLLPEEKPLQKRLERAIGTALRPEENAEEVTKELRYLCKQGAPLQALRDVLSSSLIVRVTETMNRALEDLYYLTPKWVQHADHRALQ